MKAKAQAPWGVPYVDQFEVHPAAQLFPEMGNDDLMALSADIEKNGVKRPILFYEGKLLDGRNRVRAVAMIGLDPGNPKHLPRETLPASKDPYAEAWSLNCERLNYDRKEKARIRLKVLEASGEWARQRAETAAKGNEARSATASKRPRDDKGRLTKGPVERHGDARLDKKASDPANKTAAKVAATLGVSTRTVERMRRAERLGPEEAEGPPRPKTRPYSAQRTIRVPLDVEAMAGALRQHLTSQERRLLASLIWTKADEADAAEV